MCNMESEQNIEPPECNGMYLLKMQPTSDGSMIETELIGTIYFAEAASLEIDEGSKESGEEIHDVDSPPAYPQFQKKKQKGSKYMCDVCYKHFPARGHLQIHMRTHTGEKPYSCYICGKKSARLHDLQTHILTHTNKKLYGCAYCPSRFNQKSNYTRHLKLHAESPERKFKRKRKKHICDLCQASLPNKNALLVHMFGHEGKKPFECEICEKGFTRQYDLKVHYRIHTGEKPYTCEICNIDFRQQSNYRRHVKTHEVK